MRKLIILSLLITACSSESNNVTAEKIPAATSSTTMIINTEVETTILEKVEFASSKITLTCPESRDLMYGSKFDAGYKIKFGDTPSKITVTYFNLASESEQIYLDTTSESKVFVDEWKKDSIFSEKIYEINKLPKDYKEFYFSVEVKDASGTNKEDCRVNNDVDLFSLPPVISLTNCPNQIKQGEELAIEFEVLSRMFDVSYIEFNFKADDYEDTVIYSDLENLPKKSYELKKGTLDWRVTVKDGDYNISLKTYVFDNRGEFFQTACGIKAYR